MTVFYCAVRAQTHFLWINSRFQSTTVRSKKKKPTSITSLQNNSSNSFLKKTLGTQKNEKWPRRHKTTAENPQNTLPRVQKPLGNPFPFPLSPPPPSTMGLFYFHGLIFRNLLLDFALNWMTFPKFKMEKMIKFNGKILIYNAVHKSKSKKLRNTEVTDFLWTVVQFSALISYKIFWWQLLRYNWSIFRCIISL